MGTANTTVSGKPCQAWSASTPHAPSEGYLDDDLYPDGSRAAARNYCRNPDTSYAGVWCYTTDPEVRWEKCDVPLCSGKSAAVWTTEAVLGRQNTSSEQQPAQYGRR